MAAKIAAVGAEIAARVAEMATCFKGGDAGHCRQLDDKINMLNRCYSYFTTSGCPAGLVAAMALVVEGARAAIATATLTAALAAVAVLVAALIALWEVVAALAAATAEAAALSEIAAAAKALLNLLMRELAGAR